MNAEAKFKDKYSEYLTDFKELSFDQINNESLCQNTTHKYFNFDEIVKKKYGKPIPSSPDTLVFKDNKIYCVEFKNSFIRRVNTANIKKKLENGHKVLLEIFTELELKRGDYELIFCVVYKGFDKDKWQEIHHRTIAPIIRFDLTQYKGKYFNDIITNSVDFFSKEFIKKITPNLPC